jgi:mycobactin salicyl-AMP ligase
MVARMFHSAVAPQSVDAEPPADAAPRRESEAPLCRLLATEAFHAPDRAVFRDQPNREAWSGRPGRDWSAAATYDSVIRLSSCFTSLGLSPGTRVGICLAGAAEVALALLAAERSGLIPFLLPVGLEADALARTVESASIQAAITQTFVGDERPAELLCAVAACYFPLRFLMAFGPGVPDGVVDLDRVRAERRERHPPQPRLGVAKAGLATLSRRSSERRFVFRPFSSLIAAAAATLGPARVRPEHRILSLLAPDDLRGLTVGPIAALISGAVLEHHGIFDGAALLSSLEAPCPTHLVAPGWMEPALARLDLPPSLVSVILIHDAPVRFKATMELKARVVDVLAFDEMALISGARTSNGLFALSLEPAGGRVAGDLLRVRLDEGGIVSFSGPAAQAGGIEGGRLPDLTDATCWRSSGYKADLFAGMIIGVS